MWQDWDSFPPSHLLSYLAHTYTCSHNKYFTYKLYAKQYTSFPSGVGECDIDPSFVNPLNLRRSKIYPDTFTGHEVDLEAETTDVLKPTSEDPVSTGGEAGGSSVKVTKTTVTKKVTSIKKTSTKTSSEKGFSESTSGSTSSSSSSSSGGYSSSSSHSGFGGYDDNMESSGYDEHSSRVHGRTHSRVSRKVYSSSDGSRFDENNFGGETTTDDDKDGHVISHYERTHHSSGKSPDGSSTFQETQHESRKVTVSENTNTENVPSSRWGPGGGYRRTYTENRSSSRTFDGEPKETHTRWETHQIHPAGQESENRWGDSGSSDVSGRREESWRQRSRTHTVDSSTRRTHSGQYGEDSYRRTHEGGAVTRTFGHDDSHLTDGDKRTRTWGQDSTDDRERFVWSDQTERTPYNRGTESRNREENYYEERTHKTGDISSRGRTGSGQYSGSDGDESRRVASSSQWSHTRYEDRSSSNQGFDDDRLRGTHDYRGSEGGYDDRYSSTQGHRSHQDRYDDRRYDEDEASGTYSRSYDRTRARDDYRGWHSEGTNRRHEGDGWQHRGHRRPEEEDSGRDETYRENYGSSDDSYGDSERHRSYSESRTSSWHSHSSSGYGSSDGLQHHQDVDDNYERRHAGASSERRFSHIESDGSVTNGTYTRVEVDPKTGKTTTYTRKAVYNSWPTDSEQGWAAEELSSDQRSGRTKREKELIIKPQAVTDEKTGKTMQVVHLVSNIYSW